MLNDAPFWAGCSTGYNNNEVILIDEIASGNMRVYKDDQIVVPLS